ncbi:MAG: response regulator [Candidatus Schekmanbacteria bacterium]|nr:response regulator [Candidatus Schekmanbacteria bacterium]
MIYVIDDERNILVMLQDLLECAGYEVKAFSRGAEALASLATDLPELIISDIMMPDMSGFALKDAVSARYGHRLIPFVFLTALSAVDDIVRGLDMGVDDYLVKPFSPSLLEAKVRNILERRKRYSAALFRGDLSRFPFPKVLQFCDRHGLTGEVEFQAPSTAVSLEFKGGDVVLKKLANPTAQLAMLNDLHEGTFVIRSVTLDFGALEDVASGAAGGRAIRPEPRGAELFIAPGELSMSKATAAAAPEPHLEEREDVEPGAGAAVEETAPVAPAASPAAAEVAVAAVRPEPESALPASPPTAGPQPFGVLHPAFEKPMGKLSAVRLDHRVFQIQTEFASRPEVQIRTVVLLDGSVLMKKTTAPDNLDRYYLDALIDDQHAAVTDEVNEKVAILKSRHTQRDDTTRKEFFELFERGYDAYRAGDLGAARDIWQKAHSLNPDDKALNLQLKIVGYKLGA